MLVSADIGVEFMIYTGDRLFRYGSLLGPGASTTAIHNDGATGN